MSAGPQLKVSSDTVTLTWRRGSNSGPLGPPLGTSKIHHADCFVLLFNVCNRVPWLLPVLVEWVYVFVVMAGSLLRKPILVTHIRTVLRTYSRKVLILISAGSTPRYRSKPASSGFAFAVCM